MVINNKTFSRTAQVLVIINSNNNSKIANLIKVQYLYLKNFGNYGITYLIF